MNDKAEKKGFNITGGALPTNMMKKGANPSQMPPKEKDNQDKKNKK